jgi:4-hydroxy-tetrahydrodipicolinate synthase
MIFKGLGVAVITPFTLKSEVDTIALEKILEHIITNGASTLVMLGTTGEAVTLTPEEKQKVIDTAIAVNKGRLKLVVGMGGYDTAAIIRNIKSTDLNKVDGILSVTPYYNKPSQKGLYEHYSAISSSTDKPIVLYNIPGRTGVNMTSETTLKLAHDFKNIVAVKEASGNFEQVMKIVQNKPTDFSVISGDDILTLPFMAIGFDGLISVLGNAFPAILSEMVAAAISNNYETARKIHYKLLELMNLMFVEGSPAGIKGLMNILNFCSKKVRLPLYELSDETMNKIRENLIKEKLL